MLKLGSEYGIYLYSEKIDMRNGIDGLCGIVRNHIGINPFKSKSVFIFSGRNPRMKKILVREYNRFELLTIRLDNECFIKPELDSKRRYGQISLMDFSMLTEASISRKIRIEYIDNPSEKE